MGSWQCLNLCHFTGCFVTNLLNLTPTVKLFDIVHYKDSLRIYSSSSLSFPWPGVNVGMIWSWVPNKFTSVEWNNQRVMHSCDQGGSIVSTAEGKETHGCMHFCNSNCNGKKYKDKNRFECDSFVNCLKRKKWWLHRSHI